MNCTYCQEEVNGVAVQCCECTDFIICLQCFSTGAEIGPHENDHSYHFVPYKTEHSCKTKQEQQTGGSIFGGKGNWTGREQLLLLNAMEIYGFGNWDLISANIKTRTPKEAKEEYMARYLNGSMGKVTWNKVGDCRPVLPEHTPEDRGPLAPEVTSRLPPLDASPEESRLVEYMYLRDDFEREHDPLAEELVSSLQIKMEEDDEMETALKLAHVDVYTRRLRERCRRKRVVRDYQLVAKFFSAQRREAMKKPPIDELNKEFSDNMRVFSQFLTAGEHERLSANIERGRELRHRLSELLKYRSVGLTSQDEIIHYEQHLAYQQQQQLRQSKSANRHSQLNRHRLYQFAFHLGQQWLRNSNSEDALRKRRKRKRRKFDRRKVNGTSRRRQPQHQVG